jgi:hypothetical protein
LAGAILANIPYGMTITLYLVVRKKLGHRIFKRVNSRTRTPIPATVLQLGLDIALIVG